MGNTGFFKFNCCQILFLNVEGRAQDGYYLKINKNAI